MRAKGLPLQTASGPDFEFLETQSPLHFQQRCTPTKAVNMENSTVNMDTHTNALLDAALPHPGAESDEHWAENLRAAQILRDRLRLLLIDADTMVDTAVRNAQNTRVVLILLTGSAD